MTQEKLHEANGRKILEYLKGLQVKATNNNFADFKVSVNGVAKILRLHRNTVTNHFRELERDGVIKRTGNRCQVLLERTATEKPSISEIIKTQLVATQPKKLINDITLASVKGSPYIIQIKTESAEEATRIFSILNTLYV